VFDSYMEEPITPIPEEWAKAVSSILYEGDRKKITWTTRAMQEFQAATLSAFAYEAQDSMADALTIQKVMGRAVSLRDEEGESYEFLFRHGQVALYGKICLRPSKQEIKIISAHVPLHGPDL
jgi:hypothetical protein